MVLMIQYVQSTPAFDIVGIELLTPILRYQRAENVDSESESTVHHSVVCGVRKCSTEGHHELGICEHQEWVLYSILLGELQ